MEALCLEIKQLIIQSLELEDMSPIDIDDNTPLFEATGLGLDSIDALEIGVALRKKYQLQIEANNTNNREHFYTVSNLAKFIHQQTKQPSA